MDPDQGVLETTVIGFLVFFILSWFALFTFYRTDDAGKLLGIAFLIALVLSLGTFALVRVTL